MTSVLRRIGFVRSDTRVEVGYVGAFFVAYFVLDVLTRRVAKLSFDGLDGPVLLIEAATSNPLPLLALVAIGGVAIWRSTSRLLCAWHELDHGRALRMLTVPLLVLVAWAGSLYEYNWLADRNHLLDRLLVITLAAAAWWRPVFLIPFVLHARVVASQFEIPFGLTSQQSIEEILIMILVALAGAHAVYVATGKRDTAPVMLVILAGYAAHYFVPGRGKVVENWLFDEDPENLASNGYTAGWLGHTDGSFALDLADLYATFRWPLLLATLAFELGVLLFAMHHRVMRWVFPILAAFHAVNFMTLGFWYTNWIILAGAMFIFFSRESNREWLDRNLTLARAGIMFIAIAPLGSLLFHPQGLAWFDTPVTYGQEFTVIAPDGTESQVEVQAFAPFTQDIMFSRVQFGETRRTTGPYGVVGSSDRLPELDALTSVDQIVALEEPRTADDEPFLDQTEEFFQAWIRYANERAAGNRSWAGVFDAVGPVGKYWSSTAGPEYDFDHPVEELVVTRVRGLHVDGEIQQSREIVLSLDG